MNTMVLDEGSREGILVTRAGGEDHSGASFSLKPVEDLMPEQAEIFRRNWSPWGIHTGEVPEVLWLVEGTPCWSRQKIGEAENDREETLWTDLSLSNSVLIGNRLI